MNAAITNPANLLLLILGTYLGLKLAAFLWSNQSSKHNANKYLGLLIFVQSMPFIIGAIYRFDLLTYIPHAIGIQTLFRFLLGPLAYLYVRACTQKGFQLRPILWLHFLLFAFDILYNLPFFLLSGSEKLAFYNQFVQTGQLYTPQLWNAITTIQAIIYFALSVQLVRQYRTHLSNATSSIDRTFHRWLLFFIFIIALPILVSIFFVITDYSRVHTIWTFLLGVITFLFALDLATLYKPELFHIFPHQVLIPQSSEEQKQKYENSNLQVTQKEKYLKKLIAFVELEKPYQSPDLTRAELAEKVKIPAHYLSQIINEKLKVNFIDFINGYRVIDAEEKLMDPKLSHYTILSIAYEAGFNAKSTFYSVFKKHTGMTPSAYRKQKSTA